MTSWLKGLIVAGVLLGASLTGLGLLAQWWPALDIVNNGLPFVAAGAVFDEIELLSPRRGGIFDGSRHADLRGCLKKVEALGAA